VTTTGHRQLFACPDAAEIGRGQTTAPWEGRSAVSAARVRPDLVVVGDLLLQPAGWLTELSAHDRTRDALVSRSSPFCRFAADMTNASSVPGGHGHNYGDLLARGWAAVAGPDG